MKISKKIVLGLTAALGISMLNATSADATSALRQINGESVTSRGQYVPFFGTNEYNNDKLEYYAGLELMPETGISDLWDAWMVVNLMNDCGQIVPNGDPTATKATVIKRHPIDICSFGCTNARYDQSTVKAVINAWYCNLKAIKNDDGEPLIDCASPVDLYGQSQSFPNAPGMTTQSIYSTQVNPNSEDRFFAPSYFDIFANEGQADLCVSQEDWQDFSIGFSSNIDGHLRANHTFLRNPFCVSTGIAVVDDNGNVYSDFVGHGSYGVRPACVIKIAEGEDDEVKKEQPKLKNTKGEKVTSVGECVNFVGTNRYNQSALEDVARQRLIPMASIIDLTDNYLVTHLLNEDGEIVPDGSSEAKAAAIVKESPIAVVFDQSNIEGILTEWNEILIRDNAGIKGRSFVDYLHPNSTYMDIPCFLPSYDDFYEKINTTDWEDFISSKYLSHGSLCPDITLLDSPKDDDDLRDIPNDDIGRVPVMLKDGVICFTWPNFVTCGIRPCFIVHI
jgi:hypothetical protein